MAVCGLTPDSFGVKSGEPRIGGWLWALVAWQGMTLLSACLMFILYLSALFSSGPGHHFSPQWYATVATTLLMGLFTGWTLRLMFQCSRRFPRVFIVWLLAGVLLGLKAFAFSPLNDPLALQVLLWPLLAAALFVPYLKRSRRVKSTFIQP